MHVAEIGQSPLQVGTSTDHADRCNKRRDPVLGERRPEGLKEQVRADQRSVKIDNQDVAGSDAARFEETAGDERLHRVFDGRCRPRL